MLETWRPGPSPGELATDSGQTVSQDSQHSSPHLQAHLLISPLPVFPSTRGPAGRSAPSLLTEIKSELQRLRRQAHASLSPPAGEPGVGRNEFFNCIPTNSQPLRSCSLSKHGRSLLKRTQGDSRLSEKQSWKRQSQAPEGNSPSIPTLLLEAGQVHHQGSSLRGRQCLPNTRASGSCPEFEGTVGSWLWKALPS